MNTEMEATVPPRYPIASSWSGGRRVLKEYYRSVREAEHAWEEAPEEVWQQAIQRYSQTLLSFQSDALPAVSAVVSLFCGAPSLKAEDYAAGLWRAWLPGDLLWTPQDQLKQLPGEYTAPSWSWASAPIGDGVSYRNFSYTASENKLAKVLDISLTPKTSNIFAELLGGHLLVRSTLGSLRREPADKEFPLRLGRGAEEPARADFDSSTGQKEINCQWDYAASESLGGDLPTAGVFPLSYGEFLAVETRELLPTTL